MTVGPISLPVYYDFASTLCCVAHRVIQRMASDLAALRIELVWRPLDLTTITGWPRGVVVPDARRENAWRVARELGVPVRMPHRWQDSRRAHAIALALTGSPKEPVWHERLWTAVYEEGRCLDEDELARLAADVDVDIDTPSIPARLEQLATETAAARDAGVNGVPTFMLYQWPMAGIQDDDTMRALFTRFTRKVHGESALH